MPLIANSPAKTGNVDMEDGETTEGQSRRERLLGLCHRNKSRLQGLAKEPGLRRCQDPNGKHPQRTQKQARWHRNAGSAAHHPFPESGRLRSSMAPERGICSLNMEEGMNEPREADGEARGRGKRPIQRTPWPQPLVSAFILLRTSPKEALFGIQVGNMQSSRTEAFPTTES